jgi:hypothetical protein
MELTGMKGLSFDKIADSLIFNCKSNENNFLVSHRIPPISLLCPIINEDGARAPRGAIRLASTAAFQPGHYSEPQSYSSERSYVVRQTLFLRPLPKRTIKIAQVDLVPFCNMAAETEVF